MSFQTTNIYIWKQRECVCVYECGRMQIRVPYLSLMFLLTKYLFNMYLFSRVKIKSNLFPLSTNVSRICKIIKCSRYFPYFFLKEIHYNIMVLIVIEKKQPLSVYIIAPGGGRLKTRTRSITQSTSVTKTRLDSHVQWRHRLTDR